SPTPGTARARPSLPCMESTLWDPWGLAYTPSPFLTAARPPVRRAEGEVCLQPPACHPWRSRRSLLSTPPPSQYLAGAWVSSAGQLPTNYFQRLAEVR